MKYTVEQTSRVEREVELPEYFKYDLCGSTPICKTVNDEIFQVGSRSLSVYNANIFFPMMTEREIDSIRPATLEEFNKAAESVIQRFLN